MAKKNHGERQGGALLFPTHIITSILFHPKYKQREGVGKGLKVFYMHDLSHIFEAYSDFLQLTESVCDRF